MLTSSRVGKYPRLSPFSRNSFARTSDSASRSPALLVIAAATKVSPACSASPGSSSGVTSMACISGKPNWYLRKTSSSSSRPSRCRMRCTTCALVNCALVTSTGNSKPSRCRSWVTSTIFSALSCSFPSSSSECRTFASSRYAIAVRVITLFLASSSTIFWALACSCISFAWPRSGSLKTCSV